MKVLGYIGIFVCGFLILFLLLFAGSGVCDIVYRCYNNYQQSKYIGMIENKVRDKIASPSEFYELALHYKSIPSKLENVVSCLKISADAGYLPAITQLARLYSIGPLQYRNESQAHILYRKAAEKNDPIALYQLALLEKDQNLSDQLLVRASLQSYGPALILKAKRDLAIAKTDRDYLLVLGMLSIVEGLGYGICPYPEALKLMSEMYEKGLGVPKDPARARALKNRADYDNTYFKEDVW